MLNLNLRRSGWFSSIMFAAKPEWSDSSGPLTPAQVADRLHGKRVLMLHHGYRNTQDRAADAYSRLLLELQGIGPAPWDAVIACYSPLSELKIGFSFARWRADKAGQMIAEAIAALSRLGCRMKKLTAQTHSLGAMVLLEALRAGLRVDDLVLSAPAVDNESMEPGNGRYGAYLCRAKKIFVAFSNHDPVNWFYRLARRDKMLGVYGPQEPGAIAENVEFQDFTDNIQGHSEYKYCAAYLKVLWERLAAIQE